MSVTRVQTTLIFHSGFVLYYVLKWQVSGLKKSIKEVNLPISPSGSRKKESLGNF